LEGIGWTLIFGWAHIPFGIIAAPWQILKGFKRLMFLPDKRHPSPEFVKELKLNLAIKAYNESVDATIENATIET